MLELRARLPAAQAAALAGALQLEPAAPHARLAIGAALLSVLALAAEERPVLCVVDDLQWVDEPSLEGAAVRTERLGAEGVAVLLAQRPNGDADCPGVETIELSALGEPAAREVLGAVPEEVARRVLATAGGNPLALHEIPALLSRAELEGREPIEGPLPPGQRSSACSRAASRAFLQTPAARCWSRRPRRYGAAMSSSTRSPSRGSRSSRSSPPRRPGSSSSGRARSRSGTRCCAPPRTTGRRRRAPRSPQGGRGRTAGGRSQRAWQLAAARRGRTEDVAAALERAAPRTPARGPASRPPPTPTSEPRRALARAGAACAQARRGRPRPPPAGHPDVGLARLEQAERVLATSESGDVSAVAGELRILRAQLALRTGRTAEARDLLRAQARRLQDEAPPAAAMLLLLSSLGAMAMRDHRGWLTDAERALELAGDVDLLAALAALSAGAARLTLPDVATGRRLLADGEERLGDDLGTALALAPEVVALAAHGWLWIEEYERGVELLDRLVAVGRESASVGALPYPLAARARAHSFRALPARARRRGGGGRARRADRAGPGADHRALDARDRPRVARRRGRGGRRRRPGDRARGTARDPAPPSRPSMRWACSRSLPRTPRLP